MKNIKLLSVFLFSILLCLSLAIVSCHKEKLSNNQNNTGTEVPSGSEDPGDEPGGGEGGDPGSGEETGDHVISNGVTDVDGNQYATVVLGNQEWMAENLRTTHYADGTAIPEGEYGYGHPSDTDPYWYAPADGYNVSQHGYLYNWPAVMHGAESSTANPSGVQGLCPMGWHVPSKAEWEQLFNYVGSQSEYVCGDNPANIAKAMCVTKDWACDEYEFDCTPGYESWSNNATGFSAYPCGWYGGAYMDPGMNVAYWSTTVIDVTHLLIAAPRFICYSSTVAGLTSGSQMAVAQPLRCVKD